MTGVVCFIRTICQSLTGWNFMQVSSQPSKWILHFTLRQPKQRFVAGPKRLPPRFGLPVSFPVKSPTFVASAIAQES